MAANTSVLSIEKWLESIDASLKKYSADFARLDFVNTNSVQCEVFQFRWFCTFSRTC